jgi:hypothetical protein
MLISTNGLSVAKFQINVDYLTIVVCNLAEIAVLQILIFRKNLIPDNC